VQSGRGRPKVDSAGVSYRENGRGRKNLSNTAPVPKEALRVVWFAVGLRGEELKSQFKKKRGKKGARERGV